MRSAYSATEVIVRRGIGVHASRVRQWVIAALITCGVIAGSAAGRAIGAQPSVGGAGTPVVDSMAYSVRVKLAAGRIIVSRRTGRKVFVEVRTDSGTFTLSADSAVVARWADSAATLPDPLPLGDTGKVAFKMWQLRANGDSGAHMRFARVPTDHGPELTLGVFNGAWGEVEYLGAQSGEVLDALRRDSVVTDDTAHVRSFAARVQPSDGVRASASSAGDMPLTTADTTWRASRRQAVMVPDSPQPRYPKALQSAGISGHVLLLIVVDTTGHVDMKSVQVLSTTDPRFALAVKEALPNMFFVPARVDGKKVRQQAFMPFDFALKR
jgi:TonB family protein